MKILLISAGFLLLVTAPVHAQETAHHAIVELPDAIDWQPGPPSLPPGAEVAVLEGDPSQPGPFTMRLRMPDGYRISPHFHPVDERVTVISGTFHVGMGETFDTAGAVSLGPGAYAALSPGVAHYAWTEGATVIQLNNIGPWSLKYVDPDDDPRNAER